MKKMQDIYVINVKFAKFIIANNRYLFDFIMILCVFIHKFSHLFSHIQINIH